MKFVIVLAAVLAVSAAQYNSRYQARPTYPQAPVVPAQAKVARPSSSDAAASVVASTFNVDPNGAFDYNFQTDNGIAAQAQGTPRDFGGNPPLVPVVAQGSFSWTSPEGEPIAISYIADENGYQPTGSAIPTPPPVPEAIARSLQYVLGKTK